jgi:hypothetical protein
MKVRLVISPENASWIIGKMCARLADALLRAGVSATIAGQPDDDADINHWMSHSIVLQRAGRKSSVFITHVDDPYKTSHIATVLRDRADVGLCMSRDMMRALIGRGIPAERLWYVLPAFDPPEEPRRIRISIATRLYDDGRKREALLLKLAKECDLSPFHFEIAGLGWDEVVPRLEQGGASVRWRAGSDDYQSDHRDIIASMRGCDFYLYLGMDEGSLGTLDALALGLKTIVTPQGFHLDIPGGISEPVVSYEDVQAVFDRLAKERNARIASVSGWSWDQYARDHVLVWEALLRGQLPSSIEGEGRYTSANELAGPGLTRRGWRDYYKGLFSPGRALDALARLKWIQPLRRIKARVMRAGRR